MFTPLLVCASAMLHGCYVALLVHSCLYTVLGAHFSRHSSSPSHLGFYESDGIMCHTSIKLICDFTINFIIKVNKNTH